MAGLISSSALLGAGALNLVGSTALFKSANTRTIVGSKIGFYAPCNIVERSSDDYSITSHPTELGIQISDHMFRLPKRLEIELVYSVSGNSYILRTAGAALGIGTKPKTIKQYYDDFRTLQSNNELLNITTGKRQYSNMVIESISNITDVTSEDLLKLSIRFRELIIVKSKTTISNNTDPNLSSTSNQGTVQAK